MDSDKKKDLKTAFKQKELSDARSKMALFPDQLRELRGYLSASLDELGIACDHTLGRTQEWAQKVDLDTSRVLASVREFGGYCDCEVLFNVTPDKFGWQEDP